MSIIIYNNPQSNTWRGRYTTFIHGHLEGIVLNCISLSLLSLALLLLLSCSAPLLFWSVSASIYLSLSTLSPSLSLSLSLLPCVPLILLVCLPLPYSWNLTHGKMKSWKCVLHYVTHKHTYHLIRQSDELKSS